LVNAPRPTKRVVQSLTRRLPVPPSALALFAKLTANGTTANSVLLESAEPTSRMTQRSLLVLSTALRLICRGPRVRIEPLNKNGESLLPLLREALAGLGAAENGQGFDLYLDRADETLSEGERLKANSPLSVLRMVGSVLQPEGPHRPEGCLFVGLFGYDLIRQYESIDERDHPLIPPSTIHRPGSGGEGAAIGSTSEIEQPHRANDDLGVADYLFLLADQVVVIDHLNHHAEAIANVFSGASRDPHYYAAQEVLIRIADTTDALIRDPPAELEFPRLGASPMAEVAVDTSDGEFESVVATLQERIIAGDVFQIVPSRTFSIPCFDPLAAYASLRAMNPSPYLFFANFGDCVLFGASPESAVKVDGRARWVEISPIAGTRSRGFAADGSVDVELDGRIEAELRLDEKENAEHMMLVDLARNDVARVSKPGTRHVLDLARVDRYSHVMHLVSRVRGELREDLDALHAYQACMNMGTLTGAPKIKAMQLLQRHEKQRRGHYGGAVGYWNGDGSLDTAIVIRSALVRDGIAMIRAGAGVVYDSVPRLEAEETRRKAEAVLRAIARANALVAGGRLREKDPV
jgi:anthranilate synthase component 1